MPLLLPFHDHVAPESPHGQRANDLPAGNLAFAQKNQIPAAVRAPSGVFDVDMNQSVGQMSPDLGYAFAHAEGVVTVPQSANCRAADLFQDRSDQCAPGEVVMRFERDGHPRSFSLGRTRAQSLRNPLDRVRFVVGREGASKDANSWHPNLVSQPDELEKGLVIPFTFSRVINRQPNGGS